MSTVSLNRDGNVGTLTLNRTEAANGINTELCRDMLDGIAACIHDPNIRCVLLTGAGRFFCAGGDLRSFASVAERVGEMVRRTTVDLHGVMSLLLRMPKPLVIAVNGPAAGAGLSLVLVGDVVLAARASSFTAAYTAAGLAPDGGMSFLLPRVVGAIRAKELLLTNRRLSPDEAVELGIASRVVEDAELMTQARTVAAQLAQGPTGAYGAARQLIAHSLGAFEAQMALEADAITQRAAGPDGREGVTAFLEKRKPRFTGQ